MGNFEIVRRQLVGSLGHVVGLLRILGGIEPSQVDHGVQVFGHGLQNGFVSGDRLAGISLALANAGKPDQRHRVIGFFGDSLFQHGAGGGVRRVRFDVKNGHAKPPFVPVGEIRAGLQGLLQGGAGGGLVARHVAGHAEMKLHLGFLWQFPSTFLQQTQRGLVGSLFVTGPAQRVRRGGVKRQQFPGLLRQRIGAIRVV